MIRAEVAMELMSMLRDPHGRAAIDNIAATFGVDRERTEAAIASILPELSRRIERNTLSRGGLADMVALIGASANAPPLDQTTALNDPATQAHGIAALDQIFGSKDASRAVAARAAATSGLSETIIKAMLPFIASLVMRMLARKTSGGLGDILSKIPGLGKSTTAPSGTPMGGSIPPLPFPSGSARTGAPTPMPSPMPAPAPSSSPGGFGLPGPEAMPPSGNNPYGDLSDIIRKGGGAGGATGGGTLANIVRGIIGAVLGFQSRGIMGWLIRLVVMRWGWGLLQTILRRLLSRR